MSRAAFASPPMGGYATANLPSKCRHIAGSVARRVTKCAVIIGHGFCTKVERRFRGGAVVVGGGVVVFTGPGGMTDAMHEVVDRVCSVAMAPVSYPTFESWSGTKVEAEALSFIQGFPESWGAVVVVGFGEGTNAACAVAGDKRVGAVVLVNGVGRSVASGTPWPADVWLDLIMFETTTPFFGDPAKADALARQIERAELVRLPAHADGLANTVIQSAVVDAITPVASKASIVFECDPAKPGCPEGWGTATVSRDARDGFSIEVDCEDGHLRLTADRSSQGIVSQASFRSEHLEVRLDRRLVLQSLASALSHLQHVLVAALNSLGPDPSKHTMSEFLEAVEHAWEQPGPYNTAP